MPGCWQACAGGYHGRDAGTVGNTAGMQMLLDRVTGMQELLGTTAEMQGLLDRAAGMQGIWITLQGCSGAFSSGCRSIEPSKHELHPRITQKGPKGAL